MNNINENNKKSEYKKKEDNKGLTIKKLDDFGEWYNQLVIKSEIADFGYVKGTIVIRPRGYSIWQKIIDYFNINIIKKYDIMNAYFPLFIPESFFEKEKEHAQGFSPEVAWLSNRDEENGERLAIRPTSETIIYDSYSKWIRSHRDLPLRINQWCNVVRWETKATKIFIRGREFLWQEGHSVFASKEEAENDTLNMIKEYKKLCDDLLSIPVLIGKKSNLEKFAGADHTYAIEAFMPDGKALQMGTSHNLGQAFAKSFNISYLGKDGKEHYPYQNSWGLSTRLIGATIMIHSDDKGLVLPPRVCNNKVVVVPIIFEDSKEKVIKKCRSIINDLSDYNPIFDDRDEYSSGYKFNDWELKGIPIRIEFGPTDLEKDQAVVVRRDNLKKEIIKLKDLKKEIVKLLDDIQDNLYQQAKKQLKNSIAEVDNYEEFKKALENKRLIHAFWCEKDECEIKIKEETGATTRCITFDEQEHKGKCVYCGKSTKTKIYFSKSY
ncbi:MAG: proline--tRNA ligase [Candidatus Woesearchaeota archaeon]